MTSKPSKAPWAHRMLIASAWLALGLGAAAQPSETTLTLPATLHTEGAARAEGMQALAAQLLAEAEANGQPHAADPRFRLELLAGRPAAALASIRELRARPGASAQLFTQYELYAQALAAPEGFEAGFTQALARRLAELSNVQALDLAYVFGTSVPRLRAELAQRLERHQGQTQLSREAALPLLRAYLVAEAYGRMQAYTPALLAADDARRYQIDAELDLPGADGVPISALLVRPRQAAAPLTSLLQFTIYAEPEQGLTDAKKMAARGYASMVAYTRGKGRSPGPVTPYEHDGADARAVIEWLAAQPWSDGRVGMYGGSYNTFAQWAAAKHKPAALKALATSASTAPGIDVPMEGNVFMNFLYPWVGFVNGNNSLDYRHYGDSARWARLDRNWYRSGRAYRELDRIDGQPNPLHRRWLDHPSYDAYWQRLIPYQQEFAAIDIRVLAVTGYFDGAQVGALYYFEQHLRHRPDAEHRLLIGPYAHFAMQSGPSPRESGYSLDPVAMVDLQALRLQWFDHVFKGGPRPALLKDRVNYQVMGANTWKHAPSLEAMRPGLQRFHLAAGEGNVHRLATEAPKVSAAALSLRVDFKDRSDADLELPPDRLSPRLVTRHALHFASAPLPHGGELSGLFAGRLHFSVNKADVDLAITLYEQLPSGESFELSSWMRRASHAKDRSRRELLKPGRPTQLDFRAERLVSRQLAPGSRLLLTLGVLKQPDLQINYGSGKDVSDETLPTDAGAPLQLRLLRGSWVELPLAR
jgi:putative CocE/NonD family hydrolase